MGHRRCFFGRFERQPFTGKVRVAPCVFPACSLPRTCWLPSLVWTATILRLSIFPCIFLQRLHLLGGGVFISMMRETNISCRTATSFGGSGNELGCLCEFMSSSSSLWVPACPCHLRLPKDPFLSDYFLCQLEATSGAKQQFSRV